MKRNLVLDIGNSILGAALFEEDLIVETFHLSSHPLDENEFRTALQKYKIARALVGSDNPFALEAVKSVLKKEKIPFYEVDPEKLSLILDVEVPQEVGIDRIANCYGALSVHPDGDSIIVDMGTAVVFDVVTKGKRFLGGAIYPGVQITAKALHDYTAKLPMVEVAKPPSALSRSTIGNIQSGIYYGLVATIEKIVKEIKKIRFSQSKVNVIATGGLASNVERKVDSFLSAQFRLDLEKDLKGIVDYFEPDLTFIGLHQILKEQE